MHTSITDSAQQTHLLTNWFRIFVTFWIYLLQMWKDTWHIQMMKRICTRSKFQERWSRNITDSAHNACLTKLSTIPLIKGIWTSSVPTPSSKNFPSPDKNWQCTQCGVHHACEKSISNPIDQQYSHQLIIPTASSKNFTSRIWNIKPPIDGQNCHH